MALAELEIFCSRPHAPTRRVALGQSHLPCEPTPGFGGVLLGGVVARFVAEIDEELIPDVKALTHELETGRRVPQPRLRFRLQVDTVGLDAVSHRLVGNGDVLAFEFDDRGAPEQQILGAVYAAAALTPSLRRPIMTIIRRAITWGGPIGPELIASLSGFRGAVLGSRRAVGDPVQWALSCLGLPIATSAPSPKDVQRNYRERLREVHPDHGAEVEGAAQRIAELSEARRILIGR
ncbi:MAG: J domain-containing protein [Actinobacteria bacterium]|nr:J domain-containing protein [Actinomycetota bacterium]